MSKAGPRVVIAGAGHAGGSLAALLRQYGWKAPIILIGDEPVAPYQRPPLSKAWLKGEADMAGLLLRAETVYRANAIELRIATRIASIERHHKTIVLNGGEAVGYDHLVLALGAYPRRLLVPGHDLDGILSLRSLADADRLQAELCPGARLAVIGAGYIGLEVAASARACGVEVVVIEREARILPRVASAPLSEVFQRYHAVNGVRIMLGAAVTAFEGSRGRVSAVCLADGSVVPCDAALIGIGVAPNDGIASAAGLVCADGIAVDGEVRSSDPAISAIGDCTRRPLPRYGCLGRLESVPNALEQAKQAAAALCGRPAPAPEVPWFWSDQYDIRLQIAGLLIDVAQSVVRGDPACGSCTIFHLTADGTVQAVEAVNAPAEFLAGRMMIATRKQAIADRLQDVSRSMRDLAG